MILRWLRAYPTLLRVGFAGVVAYRAEFIIWILTTNMPLVMLAVWHAVAAQGPVGRFGQGEFTAYYVATLMVRLVTSTWAVWQISTEIRDGTLSARLLRPLPPLVAYSAEHLAAVPMRLIVTSPLLVLLLSSAGPDIALRDPAMLAIFLASLAGAWLLSYFTMVTIGASAFFVESAMGVFELWLGVYWILSGYLIPLELMPPWVAAVARALPFRYMLGFPVETLIGLLHRGAALRELAIQWTYVLAIGALALMVWRRGGRRFAAFGG